MEIWKDIKDYEGLYQVSNIGNVKSISRIVNSNAWKRPTKAKILKITLWNTGYCRTSLFKNTQKTVFPTHRLVVSAFLPNPENKPQVNHKNGIKNDNRIENLEWCTCSENQKHAVNTGLIIHTPGENHHNTKLKNKDRIEINILRKKGYLLKDIAEIYNVSCASISLSILKNQ